MISTLFNLARHYLHYMQTTSNYIPRFRTVIRIPQSKSPSNWFLFGSTWQLLINHSKALHLDLGHITQFPPYEIGGYKIPQLETMTDLDIISYKLTT